MLVTGSGAVSFPLSVTIVLVKRWCSRSENRRGFGEDSGWTRGGEDQRQNVNVPAVQLEWVFCVFDTVVHCPVSAVLTKLQTPVRSFFHRLSSHSLEEALAIFFPSIQISLYEEFAG